SALPPMSRRAKRQSCGGGISRNGAKATLTPIPTAGLAHPTRSRPRAAPSRTSTTPGPANWLNDPGRIRAPVAIIRGEWDGMCPDADAGRLFDALSASPLRRDVKIGRATHLMHFEEN